MAAEVNVEVVYATAKQQNIVNLVLPSASTIRDAVIHSGLYNADLGNIAVGIFGKLRSLDYQLQDGDRVEIYTALLIDPKEARRQRAKRSKRTKKRKFPKSPDDTSVN